MSARHAETTQSRTTALLALLLLVPAPSIGTALAMTVDATQGTSFGQGAYALSKVWLVMFPVAWLLWVDGGKLSISAPRRGGFGAAAGLGLLLGLGVFGAYSSLGSLLIDPAQVRAAAQQNGIGTPATYLLLATYLIAVNSLLEEYVWRWFVFSKCERLLRHGAAAAALSAAFFTLHHVVALKAQFAWLPTILASTGVFIGGLAWSWCYSRYRSVWPGYVSHVIVDIAILAIGWRLVFGGA